MANKNSNFPTNQLNNLPEKLCSEVVSNLRELALKGKPKNITELRIRINDYFAFCEERDFRPGIESLCLSLSISRQGFWQWCRGENCSGEWATECQMAKQFILTFLEQLSLTGKINPASGIFYLKNWGDYKDSISFDDVTPTRNTRQVLTADQLPKLGTNVKT